jgi:hypothetical protein
MLGLTRAGEAQNAAPGRSLYYWCHLSVNACTRDTKLGCGEIGAQDRRNLAATLQTARIAQGQVAECKLPYDPTQGVRLRRPARAPRAR